MNFLNQSDLNGKPLVKYIIIGLVVVNAFVLAFLLFGPRIGPSAKAPAPSSPDSTDAMTEESMTYEDYNSADSSEAYTSYETPAEAEEYPQKAEDEQYTYTFSAWEPAPAAVSGNEIDIYRPTYTKTEKQVHVHTYGAPVWTWSKDLTKATAKFVCANCGDTQTLEASVTERVTKPATDTEEGEKTITASVVFNGNSYTDVKKQTIEKTAHTCPCGHFVDMPPEDTPEHHAIDWAFTHKPQITSGMDSSHFGTEAIVNRAQAMVFLWAAKNKPAATTTTSSFVDVKKTDWFYKAVMWAVENKITSGTDSTHFSPNKTCNRSEILAFLYAAMGKPKVSITNPYSDVSSQWYKKAALWAYSKGIEKGEKGKFNASTPCTRTAVVLYLYRFETGKDLAK